MSSAAREREKRAEWAAKFITEEQERQRKEALPMHDRIEEAELSGDLKDILHRMAQKLEME